MPTNILTIPKKWAVSLFLSYISRKNGLLFFYTDGEAFELIRRIKKERETMITAFEAYQLYALVRKIAKIPGDIAEVGVYNGGSAKLISEIKGPKSLHLFDTFEGHPELSVYDDPRHAHRGESAALFDDVRDYLKQYPNVHLYKGLFPSSAGPVENTTFSFVHLDVDLYESTLNCLQFFYPRMNKGGVIISHDYPSLAGVRKAVDEFFADKPEIVLTQPGCWQATVIKV